MKSIRLPRVFIRFLPAFFLFLLILSLSGILARPNIALHNTATADSYVGARTPAMVVDGVNSGESRWENNYIDGRPDSAKGNAWVYVDLGAKYLVDSVAIYWEHSGSGNYVMQVWESDITTPSANDTGWTILLRDTTLTYTDAVERCLSFLKLPPKETRFVRMHSYKRLWNPGWGISIYEFEVYGTAVSAVKPTEQMQATISGLSMATSNAGVSIKVKGPEKNSMLADIFAPNGRLVRHLLHNDAFFWDYRDNSGSKVTNGTYMIRVIASGKTIIDKTAVNR